MLVRSRFHHQLVHPNHRLCYEWFPDYCREFYGESTKFKDYCFLCVSFNRAPDINFISFFISAAQSLICFSMTNGDNFVKGTFQWWIVTYYLNLFFQSFIFSSFFWSDKFKICFSGLGKVVHEGASMLPCKIVHHPCLHPPRSTSTGDTWILKISVRKYHEFKGWYTHTEEFH